MRIPKKLVVLAVSLVLVGLAASVAVAHAAAPIITDTTVRPSVHSTAACTECHVVTPTVPAVPGAGNGAPGGSHESTHVADPSDGDTDVVEPDGADETGNRADHHDGVSAGHRDGHGQHGSAQDAIDRAAHKRRDAAEKAAKKAAKTAEHETVSERIEERDHRDTPSVDQGGAQHDGSHHKAEGSSD